MMEFITIGLFVFGIIVCLIKEHSNNSEHDRGRSRNKDLIMKLIKKMKIFLSQSFYDYITTIIATILGVTLAIVCSNYDTNSKNCNNTIEFLKILDEELSSNELRIDALIKLNEMQDSNGDINDLTELTFSLLSLEVILTNEPYISTLSHSTYSVLLKEKVYLDRKQALLLNVSNNYNEKLFMLEIIEDIEFIRSIIKLELLYQNKNISKQELEDKMNMIYHKNAKEFTEYMLEILENLEDSEWKSNMMELFESVEKSLN